MKEQTVFYCKFCGKKLRRVDSPNTPYYVHIDDDLVYCFGGVLPQADPIIYANQVVINIDPPRPDVSPVFRRGTSG